MFSCSSEDIQETQTKEWLRLVSIRTFGTEYCHRLDTFQSVLMSKQQTGTTISVSYTGWPTNRSIVKTIIWVKSWNNIIGRMITIFPSSLPIAETHRIEQDLIIYCICFIVWLKFITATIFGFTMGIEKNFSHITFIRIIFFPLDSFRGRNDCIDSIQNAAVCGEIRNNISRIEFG